MVFYVGRYLGVERKTYDLEVVTPMFLGGADPTKAEIRAPSFKGMLRFWWRALNPQLSAKGLKNLYDKESDIFGNTEKKSKISLKIEASNIKSTLDMIKGKKFQVESKSNKNKNNNNSDNIITFKLDILHYLAYGTMEYQKGRGNVLIKEYITPKSKFKIAIQGPESYIKEVELALKYLLTFGGLGAKSRNGFGSLYCKDIEYISDIPKNGGLVDYSAFSEKSKLIRFPIREKWEDALSDIGLAYKDARLSLESRHSFTKRALIAKPIIVKSEKKIPDYVKNNRQAKPYFLSVNKLSEDKYQGQILFMPYKFKTTDTSETLKKYLDACEEMNQAIEKKAGGNKWQ